jgi:hypothetical protein
MDLAVRSPEQQNRQFMDIKIAEKGEKRYKNSKVFFISCRYKIWKVLYRISAIFLHLVGINSG